MHRNRWRLIVFRSEEAIVPYLSIADLPAAQVARYDQHQKEAFLKAFNSAYEEYGHDESRAFAVAHQAAKRAGKKELSAKR